MEPIIVLGSAPAACSKDGPEDAEFPVAARFQPNFSETPAGLRKQIPVSSKLVERHETSNLDKNMLHVNMS